MKNIARYKMHQTTAVIHVFMCEMCNNTVENEHALVYIFAVYGKVLSCQLCLHILHVYIVPLRNKFLHFSTTLKLNMQHNLETNR